MTRNNPSLPSNGTTPAFSVGSLKSCWQTYQHDSTATKKESYGNFNCKNLQGLVKFFPPSKLKAATCSRNCATRTIWELFFAFSYKLHLRRSERTLVYNYAFRRRNVASAAARRYHIFCLPAWEGEKVRGGVYWSKMCTCIVWRMIYYSDILFASATHGGSRRAHSYFTSRGSRQYKGNIFFMSHISTAVGRPDSNVNNAKRGARWHICSRERNTYSVAKCQHYFRKAALFLEGFSPCCLTHILIRKIIAFKAYVLHSHYWSLFRLLVE